MASQYLFQCYNGTNQTILDGAPNRIPFMALISHLRRVGNKVYDHAFPIYFLCYRAFKACADRAEHQLLKRTLCEGAVVVDAGANIGIYSQFLSRCVGPTGVVHSFEPSQENFKRLQSAVRKLANVRLSEAAVGEYSGKSKLYVSDKLNVDHRTYATEGDSCRAVPIDIVALDDYFKPGQRVDLIKMDIQGYELHALLGANRVLVDNPNVKLVLEFWPYGLKQAGANWIELIEALYAKNMSVFQITKHGLRSLRSDSVSENPEWYVNLFVASE
jgi:FkbM family methyltransferase